MPDEIKNIETSSKNRGKNLKDTSPSSLPFGQSEIKKREAELEIEKIGKKEGVLTVDEATKLLADLKKKQEQIRRMVDELYQRRGTSPDALRKHMSNPKNFSPEEWENLQKHRQTYIKLLDLPAEEMKEEAGRVLEESTGEPFKSKNPTNRRGSKAGAARRRGWLPMR